MSTSHEKINNQANNVPSENKKIVNKDGAIVEIYENSLKDELLGFASMASVLTGMVVLEGGRALFRFGGKALRTGSSNFGDLMLTGYQNLQVRRHQRLHRSTFGGAANK